MRIVQIHKGGTITAYATPILSGTGELYYALVHGQEGRGRWQLRLPLPVRLFGRPASKSDKKDLLGEFRIKPLGRKDAKGNEQYMLIPGGEPDGKVLVVWHLDGGYRGSATYKVAGNARVIGEGYVADGMAGRLGGYPAPLVLVSGPCVLTWHRTGRLYGTPPNWVARFDGETWSVSPEDNCVLDDAALNY